VYILRAHGVRRIDISWAVASAGPLLDVLHAGTRRSNPTFSDFYLKDVSTIREGMFIP
jgi:hypothetical protein